MRVFHEGARIGISIVLCCTFCWTQGAVEKTPAATTGLGLKIVKRAEANEFAPAIMGLPTCDNDGNVYIKSSFASDSVISKYNEKGGRTALLRADSLMDLKIDGALNFNVSPEGVVRQIMYEQKSPKRWVITFAKDGTYQSKTKLDPPFEIGASEVAAFPSGELIVTGLRHSDNPDLKFSPFTGIFSSTGALLKQITLSDDKDIHDMQANGDSRVTPYPGSAVNSAVQRGALEMGADGAAYIMRRLSPAILYVVSSDGTVLRRFTVDPGEDKRTYMPISMHMSRQRIAILFYEAHTRNLLLKIVDLEGRPIASYNDPSASVGGKPLTLGVSFVCFQDFPERYIFLGVTDQNKLEFRTVEPR